jgi:transcriptional regulator with XRE-family HTH domain
MRMHRISRADMARVSGCMKQQVSKWLHKRPLPSLENMLILDEACDEIIQGRNNSR